MRSRSLSVQHDAAVARRLELLTTELAAARGGEAGLRTRPEDPQQVRRSRFMAADETPAFVDVPALGRVAGDLEPRPLPVAPRARMPGRHASRRGSAQPPAAPARGLLPEGLRGQLVWAPGQVAVVAVLVAAGLALTCWWLVRSGGRVQPAPTVLPSASALVTPDAGPSDSGGGGASMQSSTGSVGTPSSPSGRVVVDVAGKVRRPGIAVLRQGARVIDAVRAAGGARSGVDLGALNLARVLVDGEQIVVGAAAAPAPAPAPGSGAPVSGLVDINTADQTALESLPDVGPVTAQAILTWRAQHGGFSSVDQLLDVDGIGDATLAKLKPYVTV